MPPSLPNELLRIIIDSVAACSSFGNSYRERQASLCAFSLVSHRCREIAQPLLVGVVRVESPTQLRKALDRIEFSDEHESVPLQHLDVCLRSAGFRCLALERVSRIVPSLPSLTVQTVESDQLSLAWLPHLQNLVSLQLVNPDYVIPDNFVLSNLRALSLQSSSSEMRQSLLSPETLPSLRALGLDHGGLDEARAFRQFNTKRLLPHLEALYLNFATWNTIGSSYSRSMANKTLISCRIDQLLDSLVHGSNITNVRIHGNARDVSDAIIIENLTRFTQRLQTSMEPTQLELVYLDQALHPQQSTSREVSTAMEETLRVCQELSIDIVWEKSPFKHPVDPYISEDFWTRKRKKEQGASKGKKAVRQV